MTHEEHPRKKKPAKSIETTDSRKCCEYEYNLEKLGDRQWQSNIIRYSLSRPK